MNVDDGRQTFCRIRCVLWCMKLTGHECYRCVWTQPRLFGGRIHNGGLVKTNGSRVALRSTKLGQRLDAQSASASTVAAICSHAMYVANARDIMPLLLYHRDWSFRRMNFIYYSQDPNHSCVLPITCPGKTDAQTLSYALLSRQQSLMAHYKSPNADSKSTQPDIQPPHYSAPSSYHTTHSPSSIPQTYFPNTYTLSPTHTFHPHSAPDTSPPDSDTLIRNKQASNHNIPPRNNKVQRHYPYKHNSWCRHRFRRVISAYIYRRQVGSLEKRGRRLS